MNKFFLISAFYKQLSILYRDDFAMLLFLISMAALFLYAIIVFIKKMSREDWEAFLRLSIVTIILPSMGLSLVYIMFTNVDSFILNLLVFVIFVVFVVFFYKKIEIFSAKFARKVFKIKIFKSKKK